MEIAIDRPHPNAVVLRPSGRLDLASAPALKQLITELVADGSLCLVIDLETVGFIDSSGLGALISGLKLARHAGGDLRIARPNEQAALILQLTALERVLHPYATPEEALGDQ
jgi:anti-sigma B factor antagonist